MGGRKRRSSRSSSRGPTPRSGKAAEPPPPARRPYGRLLAIALVVFAAYFLLFRAPGPGTIGTSVLESASAAGCDDLERPVEADPSRDHLGTGEAFSYVDPPAAAGPHDPSPLEAEPRVHEEPVSETRAVHNLEHAYVLVSYRPAGEGGLSEETIAHLEELAAGEDRVIMAPYAGLPDGTGLALRAWNTRWTCPSTLEPDTAVEIAAAFIDAYRGTTNAPEAPRGLLGPLFTG